MIPPIASRFVAGETPAEVLDHVRALNERNVKAIVNLLGEHYDDRGTVESDVGEYRALVAAIADGSLDACISVKPTQLGLDLGKDVFRDVVGTVVDEAAAEDVFVWIDMEDHETTDATLDAYAPLARAHDGGVGVCVQANLRRTRSDVERLAPLPGKVRFTKGAYDEPPAIAYQTAESVNEAYRDLLSYAFRHFDDGIAVASHDQAMIEYAIELHEEYGTDFEFQLLMGVREDAQYELAERYEVWQYVPYGARWKSYFYRRVMERKENALFAIRAVLGS